MQFEKLKTSNQLRRDYARRGGRSLRRWVCQVGDEFIRVMYGFEPADYSGRMEHHVSVSVGSSPAAGASPTRLPTDQEFEAGIRIATPQGVTMEEDNIGGDGTVRHAWGK